ncbi:hypothetical protein ACLOJK_041940, partial [Asimina triloba]
EDSTVQAGVNQHHDSSLGRKSAQFVGSNSKIANLDRSRKRIIDGQLGRKISTIRGQQEDGQQIFLFCFASSKSNSNRSRGGHPHLARHASWQRIQLQLKAKTKNSTMSPLQTRL